MRATPSLRFATLLAALLVCACGDKSPAPSPSPTPSPSPQTVTLTGTVRIAGGAAPIAGAIVDVVSGANLGRTATTNDSGQYALTSLTPGSLMLRVSAPGYASVTQSLTVTAAVTQDFALTAAAYLTSGRALDAVSAAALAGVMVSGDDIGASITGSDGAFSLNASSGSEQPRLVVFTGPGIVERRTHIRVPGPEAPVSLIPQGFNLGAFNEMFRVPRLIRWADAPPLAIERRTLQFTNTGDIDFTSTAEALTDDEVATLRDDLTWALPQLTGNTFSAFASVTVQDSGPSNRVAFLRSGRITVARFAGLTAATGFWGYSRWQFRSDGTVIGGTIMLDRDFDRSGSVFRRSLRSHELGHALGCNHVTVTISVMNSDARTEPNGFDRAAARIAFQRAPGNVAPDSDPDVFSVNRAGGPTTWSRGEG